MLTLQIMPAPQHGGGGVHQRVQPARQRAGRHRQGARRAGQGCTPFSCALLCHSVPCRCPLEQLVLWQVPSGCGRHSETYAPPSAHQRSSRGRSACRGVLLPSAESWRAGPEAQKRELLELQAIYRDRGLSKELARQVSGAECRRPMPPLAAVLAVSVHRSGAEGSAACRHGGRRRPVSAPSQQSALPTTMQSVIGASAVQVAVQLSEKDVIRAHARDELGIDMDDLSNPWSAAGASAVAFVVGAGTDENPGSRRTNHGAVVHCCAVSQRLGRANFGCPDACVSPDGLQRVCPLCPMAVSHFSPFDSDAVIAGVDRHPAAVGRFHRGPRPAADQPGHRVDVRAAGGGDGRRMARGRGPLEAHRASAHWRVR